MLKFVLVLCIHSKHLRWRLVYPYIQEHNYLLPPKGGKFLGFANKGTYRITNSFLNSITVIFRAKYFHIHSRLLDT